MYHAFVPGVQSASYEPYGIRTATRANYVAFSCKSIITNECLCVNAFCCDFDWNNIRKKCEPQGVIFGLSYAWKQTLKREMGWFASQLEEVRAQPELYADSENVLFICNQKQISFPDATNYLFVIL